ncbi:TPA: hypothetical protein MO340_004312 [Salmonella enterica subsp. salamae serovar 35:g,m,s,t:-]|nr:hypothetical protein [Salmonella enterica subsp. salamae serovar 35:g,m,s,t:-]HCA3549782.1 hypothetical protein [Salmonella enterica subsp. salamae serovar 35:g,m,s,t:-]
MDLVRQLRRLHDVSNLEKVVEHMESKLTTDEALTLQEAADHRRAELAVGQLFDKVPKSAWKYVR